MKITRFLLAAFVLGAALPAALPSVQAQGQASSGGAQVRQIEPQEFVRLAHSSSTLQYMAAKLAAERETRPEVKAYATAAVAFRQGLLQRIETFSQAQKLALPSVKEFEHRVIMENLEPLDYLALSRRYAEVQIQALEQEMTIYQAASRSSHQETKAFADQVLPELQKQLDGAQKMYESVRP